MIYLQHHGIKGQKWAIRRKKAEKISKGCNDQVRCEKIEKSCGGMCMNGSKDFWYLSHHGIKGQKWGVRNGPPYPLDANDRRNFKQTDRHITAKTKYGETIHLDQRHTPKFTKFIAKYFPKLRENIMNDKSYKITVDNKEIGELEIFKTNDTSLNVVWVGIDESQRGKGYASAVMKSVVKFGNDNGFKEITLEVPGNSPDARHIYEKIGFVAGRQISNPEEDYTWGGLTEMKLKL